MVLQYGRMSQARLLKIDKVPASLRLQVLERLREAIISGHLAPGVRLTERELTEQMQLGGDLDWGADNAEQRVAELLQLIVAMREYQFN